MFCPRVLVGLTKPPEPALQRTIRVQLVMRTEEQKAELYVSTDQSAKERALKERCILWALQMAEQVRSSYKSDELREELESLLGPGRVSDDIWLPVFAVASAATQMDQESGDTLKTAAKELTASSTKNSDKPSVLAQVEVTSSNPEESKLIARVALNLLEFSGPLTPAEFAKRVTIALGRKVTDQKLGKSLSKTGIRSTKQNGRRVLVFDATALRVSRTLGSSAAEWQGQEDSKKGETEATL